MAVRQNPQIVDRGKLEFHPFADLFPMLEEKALAELAADIKAESQREPIFLWQGKIIDGRNRYRACKIVGVEPVLKRIEFPGGEAEALAYVVSKNLKRRHLFFQQRVEIAAKIANMKQGARTDLSQPSAPVPKVSQAQAAEILHVSERSVRNARVVVDLAPELLDAVRAGKMGLRQAAEIARHGPPIESEAPFDPDAEAVSTPPTKSEEPEPPEEQLARVWAKPKAVRKEKEEEDRRYDCMVMRKAFKRRDAADQSEYLMWLATALNPEQWTFLCEARAAFEAKRS